VVIEIEGFGFINVPEALHSTIGWAIESGVAIYNIAWSPAPSSPGRPAVADRR